MYQILFPSIFASSPQTPFTESEYNDAISLSITNANHAINEAIQVVQNIIQLKRCGFYQN